MHWQGVDLRLEGLPPHSTCEGSLLPKAEQVTTSTPERRTGCLVLAGSLHCREACLGDAGLRA